MKAFSHGQRIYGNRDVHIRDIDNVIASQVETSAAANIRLAGGATAVFERAMAVVESQILVNGQES